MRGNVGGVAQKKVMTGSKTPSFEDCRSSSTRIGPPQSRRVGIPNFFRRRPVTMDVRSDGCEPMDGPVLKLVVTMQR
jgi:hypothetical protein